MHSAICLTYDVDGGTDWRDSKEAIKALCFESMEAMAGFEAGARCRLGQEVPKPGRAGSSFKFHLIRSPNLTLS